MKSWYTITRRNNHILFCFLQTLFPSWASPPSFPPTWPQPKACDCVHLLSRCPGRWAAHIFCIWDVLDRTGNNRCIPGRQKQPCGPAGISAAALSKQCSHPHRLKSERKKPLSLTWLRLPALVQVTSDLSIRKSRGHLSIHLRALSPHISHTWPLPETRPTLGFHDTPFCSLDSHSSFSIYCAVSSGFTWPLNAGIPQELDLGHFLSW